MKHSLFARLATLGLIFGLVALPWASPRLAAAHDQSSRFLNKESVTIDEPIDDDVYVSGGQVLINKDIGQDLIVFGGTLQISGNIQQDLLAAGGNIAINGAVADDLRVGGGSIVVSGNIGDELLAGGGTVDIAKNVTIGGDVVLGAGMVSISGNISGNAKIGGGEVIINGVIKDGADIRAGKITINGTIEAGAILVAKEIVLGADSRFVGDVRYWNKTGALDIAAHVKDGEAKFDETLQPRDGEPSLAASAAAILMALLWALASSALILLLLVIFLRGFFVHVEARAIKNFWKDLGIGIGFLLVAPIAAIILLVSLVGAPIGLILLAGYIATLYMAEIFASLVMAIWLAERRKAKWSKAMLFLVSFGILVLLNLIQLIPIAGWIATGILIFAVVGSTLVVKWKILKQYM